MISLWNYNIASWGTMQHTIKSALITNEYQLSSWGDQAQPAWRAANLSVICELIVKKMWDPRHVTNPWTSVACYDDIFPYLMIHLMVLPLSETIVLNGGMTDEPWDGCGLI
jgi:hypothetical protein